jgi:hypothetical protein
MTVRAFLPGLMSLNDVGVVCFTAGLMPSVTACSGCTARLAVRQLLFRISCCQLACTGAAVMSLLASSRSSFN